MIVWYGERGVVNAIVQHLDFNAAGKQFLKCVRWANGEQPTWLDRITEVTFVVELGLADFGNPDLILICHFDHDEQPRCVFIEAKVVPYTASAILNNQGMIRGFNSACNGQLALKYRFARALESWDGEQEQIIEPQGIYEAYQRHPSEGGLADPVFQPRRLQKRQIIAGVLRPLGLAGISLDRFSFVAMTWDREPFFSAGDLLPRFLDKDGNDIFDTIKPQVGWIGYQELARVSGLIEAIRPALALMVGSIEPTEMDVTTAKWPSLATQAINKMPANLQHMVAQLEQNAKNICGNEWIIRYTGSISVRSASRVEAKIIPLHREGKSSVLLGVRPEWPLQDWSGLKPSGYKVIKQPFHFVQLPNDHAEAMRIADCVLMNLRDALAETCEFIEVPLILASGK